MSVKKTIAPIHRHCGNDLSFETTDSRREILQREKLPGKKTRRTMFERYIYQERTKFRRYSIFCNYVLFPPLVMNK
jgi:hypothetical protein